MFQNIDIGRVLALALRSGSGGGGGGEAATEIDGRLQNVGRSV